MPDLLPLYFTKNDAFLRISAFDYLIFLLQPFLEKLCSAQKNINLLNKVPKLF